VIEILGGSGGGIVIQFEFLSIQIPPDFEAKCFLLILRKKANWTNDPHQKFHSPKFQFQKNHNFFVHFNSINIPSDKSQKMNIEKVSQTKKKLFF
jgi:hypothetical protein